MNKCFKKNVLTGIVVKKQFKIGKKKNRFKSHETNLFVEIVLLSQMEIKKKRLLLYQKFIYQIYDADT